MRITKTVVDGQDHSAQMAAMNGDTVSVSSYVTTRSARETHHIQAETQMRFVQSDCGNVKPTGGDRK